MQNSEQERLSRREFGRVAAAAAAGLSLVPGALAASLPAQKSEPMVQEAKPAGVATEAPSAEAQALAGIVKLRYGSRLDEAAMKDITRSLNGGLKAAAALRKVTLDNSDAPAFVFRAWRGEGD